MILEHSMPIDAKMLVKREGAKAFNILCNILRREKIEDFRQGWVIFCELKYALLNFIGDKIFAS